MKGKPRGITIELETIEFDLGGEVAAYYFADHDEDIAGLAIDPALPTPAKLACQVEGIAYHTRRPPKGGRKFMLEARDAEDLDPNAILAIRSVIEDLRPGWVEEVKDACRISNHPRVIANWCEMSVAVVVAIIETLKARGELPEG